MADEVRLSVIIPAYNEESRLPGTLAEVCAYLAGQSYDSEVIVVDDGSTDGTVRAIRESGIQGPLRLVQHEDRANHGKGAAVRRGMTEARGAFRIFMDADNSTTIDQIAAFWPWFERGYDVVIGSRKAKGAQVRVRQSWHKELAGRLGNYLIQALAVPGISDTQAGFKMFTGPAADALFARQTIDRWGYDIEILAVARLMGYRIREVPIVWVNSTGSKVRLNSYIQVLNEIRHIRRTIKTGGYVKPESHP